MKHQVLLLAPDTPAFAGNVRKYLPKKFSLWVLDATEEEVFDQTALWKALPTTEFLMVWSKVTREMIESAPMLRFIQVLGSGSDLVDVKAAQERKIPIGTTRGANAISCGELVFGYILVLYRKLTLTTLSVKRGEWIGPELRKSGLTEIYGKTVGLIGFGTLGQAIAKIGRGFGVKFLYYQRHRMSAKEERRWRVSYAALDELLARADVVSIQIPLTSETKGFIGRRELSLMKQSAILINIARGPVIDQEALAEFIKSGKIGGAGLDVFVEEPIEVEDPLLHLDQVVFTPHVGGSTQEALARNMKQACDNVRRVAAGKLPLHPAY